MEDTQASRAFSRDPAASGLPSGCMKGMEGTNAELVPNLHTQILVTDIWSELLLYFRIVDRPRGLHGRRVLYLSADSRVSRPVPHLCEARGLPTLCECFCFRSRRNESLTTTLAHFLVQLGH